MPPARYPADVKDVARGGASFRLREVLVTDKITVLDYWAAWCTPCKRLGAMMEKLAAQHANLAIRKAEVVDFEHPIAKRHLHGENALPLLRVYDGHGTLLRSIRSSSPGRVKKILQQLLKTAASTKP